MKKVIAKEFLLFIVGIIFGIIFLGSIKLYKDYLINKDLKYSNEIYSADIKLKELNLEIYEVDNFRLYVYNFLRTYFASSELPSLDNFYKKLNKKEYIKIVYENIEDLNKSIRSKEIEIIYPYDELPYDLKTFENKIIEKNTSNLKIDYNKLNKNVDSLINKKSEIVNSYFYKTSYYNVMIRYFLFYFILIYVLRYAIIGVRWSIKELKL